MLIFGEIKSVEVQEKGNSSIALQNHHNLKRITLGPYMGLL